jgi:hypothetical protein
MVTLDSYLDLITSEHRQQPKYRAMMSVLLQPLVDNQNLMNALPLYFDLDTARGDQLDKIGEWIGISRILPIPLTGVYFALDDVNLGLDFGSLQGPFDPTTGLVVLPDENYRVLLKARIVVNQWDGTIPDAYDAWDILFAGTGFNILIENQAVMHMVLALTGPYPDAITLALFLGGYLSVKPAGVKIDSYEVNSLPYFALDNNIAPFGGLDVGAFGIIVG